MGEGERQVMNKYKALIKYEFRSLKWMLLYFLMVCSGVLLWFMGTLEEKRESFLEHSEVLYISNEFGQMLSETTVFLLIGMIVGLILLVYVQFRDAKNIEVGRFLKSLPIQSSHLYWVRMGCGVVTYTLPFLFYTLGIVVLRFYHSSWLNDMYRISIWKDKLLAFESIPYIALLLVINYLMITLVYLMLLLMQYLISNRIFAIIVTAIAMILPTYFNIMIDFRYQVDSYLIFPLAYGSMGSVTGHHLENGEGVNISYIGDVELKACLLFLAIAIVLVLGWLSSKYFMIEDQGKLIPKPLCRNIFIVVGTVSMALLPQFYSSGFATFSEVNLVSHVGTIVILGIVGYMIMYKISRIGCKEK